ncbi:UNVERIFIED_CONTAM: hypothetical protein K2H54_006134 [Gekko kuhli]
MPKDRAGTLGLWQALFFSCLVSHAGGPEVPALECHTDYAEEVVCYWDAMDTTDCARDFRLEVWDDEHHRKECAFENRTVPESASPRCVCVILETSFSGAEYTFSLVASRTNKSKEAKVLLRSIVKPRPFRNLTVTKSKERRSFTLAWEKSYDDSCILHTFDVSCQIQISYEGQEHPDLIELAEQTKDYEIFPDRLSLGKDYTARIRYKITFGSLWSEWSPPVRWHNDLEPKSGGQLWWLVLLICFLLLVLVSACYCCFARLKRQWWDQIPRPKIADDLGKKPGPVPWPLLPGDEGKVPLCATSQDHLGRQVRFTDSLPKDRAAFPGRPGEVAESVPEDRLEGKWEAILTPEAPPVEPLLTICSPAAAPGPGTQEEEEEEAACIPRHDPLAKLFLDLLEGADSTEDAETAQPVWEELPPAGPPAIAGHCLLGGTPGKSPGGSSGGDVATSSWAASPAPGLPPGEGPPVSSSQYKVLLFAQQPPGAPYRAVVPGRTGSQGDGQDGGGGGSRATPPQPSCYKSFSSLGGQPPASGPEPREHLPDFSQVDQALPLSHWPPCLGEGLLSPPQQEAAPWNGPNGPCTVDSGSPGYRPFRPWAPSRLPMGSPYKPLLLGVFSSDPKGSPPEAAGPPLRRREAEEGAWQGGPWEEPPAFALRWCTGGEEEQEEESGQGGSQQGTECFLPQVPLAPL